MIYLHWKDLRCRWPLLLSGCGTSQVFRHLSLCYWSLQACFSILQGLLWLLVWGGWSRCPCASFRSKWLTTAAGSRTEWPQLHSQPSISQSCLEMERMNGQAIFRKQTFAKKTQSGTSWAKEEEEKGLQGRLRGSSFAMIIPLCSRFGAAVPLQGLNPDVRGTTMPHQELGCVPGAEGDGKWGPHLPTAYCCPASSHNICFTPLCTGVNCLAQVVQTLVVIQTRRTQGTDAPRTVPAPDCSSNGDSAVQRF